MTELEQILTILLSSLKGSELPLKTSIDGSEFIIFYNPTTQRVERFKNNINNTTQQWSEYTGDFLNNTGVLKLGKIDGIPEIKIDSTNNTITFNGDLELLNTLFVNGDITADGAIRADEFYFGTSNGEVELFYNGNGNFSQELQESDGVIALLSDIPNNSDWLSVTGTTTSGDLIVSIGDVNANSNDSGIVVDDSLQRVFARNSELNSRDANFFRVRWYNNLDTATGNPTGFYGQIVMPSTGFTQNRTIRIPNNDGTIALTSDIGNLVPYTGATNSVDLGSNNNLTARQLIATNSINSSTSIEAGTFIKAVFATLRGVNPSITFENTTTNHNTVLQTNPNSTENTVTLTLPPEDATIATVDQAKGWSGWAQYGDSQYTSASPLVVNQGNTATINIDGLGNTIKTQLPIGVNDFYDTVNSKITPVKEGDGYNFSLSFKGTTSSQNGSATVFVDIGGAFTRLFPRLVLFPKGANNEQDFYFTSQYYTLNTFKGNGGIIKIESNEGNTSIYDISLQIHKTHDAR